MIQDLTRDTVSKVPILGDIPLLGFLFRHKGHTKEKLDLLVFVTPRIISPAGPWGPAGVTSRSAGPRPA